MWVAKLTPIIYLIQNIFFYTLGETSLENVFLTTRGDNEDIFFDSDTITQQLVLK